MGFFDNLSENISKTTKDISTMTQNAGDKVKLQHDKKVKEDELSKLYESLGRRYYEQHKEDDDEQIKSVTAAILRIKEITDEIMRLNGGVACPKCGELVKSGAKFCSACGEKINDIFEE